MNKLSEIKELISKLNQYSYEYYTLGEPTISDTTYDGLYDKLIELEKETGVILSNSPTQKVGNITLDKLQKIKHEYPMLSLGKTKKIEDIIKFAKGKTLIQTDKEDGLTTDLVYDNGQLIEASTRGDGYIGENILHNVKQYSNIPLQIPYKNKVHIIGESIIDYDTFNEINSKLPLDKQYKNPRNLVSGTVRQLNSSICKERKVKFIGYIVEGNNELKTKVQQFDFIKGQGFECVRYYIIEPTCDIDSIQYKLTIAKEYAEAVGNPIDGQVYSFDDIEYGKSLGNTSHHPLHSVAFKYLEDIEITTLKNIEWQVGRTGIITPVAIFEDVELAGTTVSRASLHNLSILKALQLGTNDEISVCKKNEIIPQIVDNLTKSNTIEIPNVCPVCGEQLIIKNDTDSEFLYCQNPNCKAKLIQSITHYCSRQAMNIEGLSEKTIEKFIEQGFLKSIIDIYSLSQYESEIITLDGFGIKSYNKLIESIEKSKQCKLENFIFGLGILNVGVSTAKDICKYFNNDWYTFCNCKKSDLLKIEGIGDIVANSVINYLENSDNLVLLCKLKDILTFTEDEAQQSTQEGILKDKTLYLTGTFNYGKKKELQQLVESNGGIFSDKFNKSCNYLVIGSLKGSTKSDKAIKMGIEVLEEDEFLKMLGVE